MKIKELPVNERPRERLIQYGVEYLSNEDLLTIIIRDGTKNMSAKDIALLLLKQINNIKHLNDLTFEKLCKINGIGNAKATLILASIELGKRVNNYLDTIVNLKITSVDNVYNYYKDRLCNKKQECFGVIYLNCKNIVIKEKIVFIGTINSSLVHPREIFKEAYMVDACSIICVHNHPSGNTEPSKEDINTTIRLKEVGNLLGIKLIDHLIISNTSYYSFLENGYI